MSDNGRNSSNSSATRRRTLGGRLSKVSPVTKSQYRADFLKKCLLRIKEDRAATIERLRQSGSDFGSVAREIVSEEINNESGDMEIVPEQVTVLCSPRDLLEEDDCTTDESFWLEIMDQVAAELEVEYAALGMFEELYAVDSGGELELREGGESVDSLICLSCRKAGMTERGRLFFCCSCGFEFVNTLNQSVYDIREQLSSVLSRHRVSCQMRFGRSNSEFDSPDRCLTFRWNGECLFATCDLCLFYGPIL